MRILTLMALTLSLLTVSGMERDSAGSRRSTMSCQRSSRRSTEGSASKDPNSKPRQETASTVREEQETTPSVAPSHVLEHEAGAKRLEEAEKVKPDPEQSKPKEVVAQFDWKSEWKSEVKRGNMKRLDVKGIDRKTHILLFQSKELKRLLVKSIPTPNDDPKAFAKSMELIIGELVTSQFMTPVLDHVFYEDRCYMLMRKARGGCFNTLLEKLKNGLDEKHVKHYMACAIQGLYDMHSKGIVHGDVKSGNALLHRGPILSWCDFEHSSRLNDDGLVVKNLIPNGSPGYGAPELMDVVPDIDGENSDGEVTRACDFFGLGCMLYHMLHGNATPFPTEGRFGDVQFVMAVSDYCEGEYKLPLENLPEGTSEAAKDLIVQLLQVQPHERIGMTGEDVRDSYRILKAHPFFKGVDWSKYEQKA